MRSMMTETETDRSLATLRAAERVGYYAIARRPATGDIGMIWSEIRPVRASYWTGETYARQSDAERVMEARNGQTPPVPPSGDLEPVTRP